MGAGCAEGLAYRAEIPGASNFPDRRAGWFATILSPAPGLDGWCPSRADGPAVCFAALVPQAWVPRERPGMSAHPQETVSVIRSYIQNAPIPVLVMDRQGRMAEFNAAALELLGFDDSAMARLSLPDIIPAGEGAALLRELDAMPDDGRVEGEFWLFGRGGRLVLVSLRAARGADGRFVAYLQDITESRRTEALLRTRLELSERGRHDSLDELMRSALDAAEFLTGSQIGYFHFVDDDQENITLQTWSNNTLETMCQAAGKGRHYPISQAGVWVDCCHARAPVIHNDYGTLPHRKGLPAGHAPVVRELGVPVMRGDRVVAILGVGNKPTDYTRDDVEAVHVIASMVMDLVERKQAEAELLASEKRFRSMFEQAAVGVALVDPRTGRFVRINAKYCAIVGYSPDEMLGKEIRELTHPDDVRADWDYIARMLHGELRTYTREKRYIRRDGSIVWVNLTVSPQWAEGEEPSLNIAVVEDITPRKAAESALRSYARRLTEMDEDLRRKLAAELHDEIGRDLTALNLNLSIIAGALSEETARNIGDRIDDSVSLIGEISRTVRGLMAKLRPPVLDDYGLPAALRWHADLFGKRTGIAVTVEADDRLPRLTAEQEIALFRIAQEALVNCAKHAGARSVYLSLGSDGGTVRLSVVDDGKGFEPASAFPSRTGLGWGLIIMRERAEQVGGTFLLDSSPGNGTRLAVELRGES